MNRLQRNYYSCSAPISNVAAKNIKSAACAGFTQLQRKLLQHLHDIKLYYVAKDKIETSLPPLFVGGSQFLCLEHSIFLNCLRRDFLVNLFENLDRYC